MPPLIFHEGVVRAKVHGHIRPVIRAPGDQARRNPHCKLPVFRHLPDAVCILVKTLRLHRFHDPLLVVICFLNRRIHALEQSVVALCIKQPLLVKARSLELMVHICCDDKIVLIPNKFQQLPVNRLRSIDISIIVNVPGPPGPACLLIRKRIKPTGIHVLNSKTLGEIPKVFLKPLSGVSKACRRRQTGTCADHNRVCTLNLLLQACNLLFPAAVSKGKTGTKSPNSGNPFLDRLQISVRHFLIQFLSRFPAQFLIRIIHTFPIKAAHNTLYPRL